MVTHLTQTEFPAVLGATFVTVKKDLHSQKLERTPSWGSTSVSYTPDSTTFKPKVLYCLLHCKSGQKLQCFLTLCQQQLDGREIRNSFSTLKNNSRWNVFSSVFRAHGVFLVEWATAWSRRTTPLEFTHILERLPSSVQTATRGLASSHSRGCNQNWKIATEWSGRTAITEFPTCYISKLNYKRVYPSQQKKFVLDAIQP